VPLSSLYPATQPLYRRVGYERAGHRFEVRIPIVRLETEAVAGGTPAPQLGVRAFAPEDLESVKRCYRSVAREHDGHLDRGPYLWSRVMAPRQGPASGFVFEGGEGGRGVEGYVFLRQERVTPGHGAVGRHDVHISDWCAATERAGRQLLAFCGEFGSMGEELLCHGGPSLPLLMLLREQRYAVRLRDYWMVRIVDLGAAVRARGWAPGLRGEVHFDVTDELFPENAGRWVARAEGGEASAERGGSGAVKLDAGALASWFCGFASLATLKRLGRASGDDAAIAAGAGLIGAGAPWMPDMF
jgi:predicted acetyltransferase